MYLLKIFANSRIIFYGNKPEQLLIVVTAVPILRSTMTGLQRECVQILPEVADKIIEQIEMIEDYSKSKYFEEAKEKASI